MTGVVAVLAVAGLLGAPGSAAAATIDVPGQSIEYLTLSTPNPPVDPGRCLGSVYLRFAHVPEASSYEWLLTRPVFSAEQGRRDGHDFPDDAAGGATASVRVPAPSGTHQIYLGGASSGGPTPDAGCANVVALMKTYPFTIQYVRATVTGLGAIEGNVLTTPVLTPVPGVPIRIAGVSGDATGKVASATTDAGGKYRVEDLAEGGYTVTATVAPDKEVTPPSHSVTVKARQTARADFRVKPASALEVTITADPKSPFVEQKVKGPLPEPVRFTVKVTNTGKQAIRNVTLPEKLTVGRLSHPYKVLEQGAADPRNPKRRTGLPRPEALKLGTLRPGRSKSLTYLYEADGDGTVSVEALAIGNVGSRRALGRGKLELRINSHLLVVTTRRGESSPSVVPAGQFGPRAGRLIREGKLIQAGMAFSIIVTVENRSNDRPAFVLPAVDGARGNLRGGVWRKHMAAPIDLFVANSQKTEQGLFAARIEPRKDVELDLAFVTDASSYTFDPVAARSPTPSAPKGGTRAEVLIGRPSAVAPPDDDPDAPFEKWDNVAPKLVVLPKDQRELDYSIDDRGMTPRPWNRWTSPAVAYGVFTVGTAEGLANWVWGTARAVVWDLPVLVGRGIAGLPSAAVKYTEQSVALWETIKDDPAARQAFLLRLQAAVLTQGGSELQKLAAREGPKLWQAVNDAVLKDLTEMHAEWYGGDWQAAARKGGVLVGTIAPDVATAPVIEAHALRWARGAKLGVLWRTPEAVDGLRAVARAAADEAEAAIDARRAAAGTVDADEALDILKTAATPSRTGVGVLLKNQHLADLIGLTEKQADWLREWARKNKVLITVRSRGKQAIRWIEQKGAVLKPEEIKTKNVNRHDIDFLGYDEADLDRVVLIWNQCTGPAVKGCLPTTGQVKAAMRKKGVQEGGKEWNSVLSRLETRTKEAAKERKMWEQWHRDSLNGQVELNWNWTDNAVNPAKAPHIPSEKVKIKLVPEPCDPFPCAYPPKPKGARTLAPYVDKGDGVLRPITGDVDAVGLTDIDGRPLPDEVYGRLLKELREGPVGASHPTTDTWTRKGQFWFKAKEEQLAPGECCFAQFGPDGEVRAVSLNLEKSLVKPPFGRDDHYLHWEGGYKSAVGAHPKR
ncbi:MAG: hypothetical protein AB1416_05240 [Actinomycetota bacterium]